MSQAPRRWRTAAILGISALTLTAACGTSDQGSDSADSAAPEKVKLRMANFLGPASPQSRMIGWWADQVMEQTEGGVEIETFDQGTLLGAPEILLGTSNNQTDIGNISVQYNPAELPLSNAATVPFVAPAGSAQAEAFTELYEDSALLKAEWDKLGIKVLFFQPVSPVMAGTKFPFTKLDDLKGKNIRAGGLLSNAIQDLGGTASALPATDIFEAMQRGVLDGWTSIPYGNMTDFSLEEVSPHVVDPGVGNTALGALIINQRVWDELPEEYRDVMESTAAGALEQGVTFIKEGDEKVCAELKANKADMSVLPAAEVEAWRAEALDGLIAIWRGDAEKKGAAAGEFWEEYTKAIDEKSGSSEAGESVLASCMGS